MAAYCGILLNTGMALVLGLAAASLVFFLPFLLSLTNAEDIRTLQYASWISCIGLCLNVVSYALRATSMGIQSSTAVQSFAIFELTASMFLQVYLVRQGWGLYGIAMGSLVRGGGDLILNTIYLSIRFTKERISLAYSYEVIRKMAGLVSFTFAGKAVETIAGNIDAFITVRLISPEAAVILRTTRTPPDIAVAVINRPAAAISPVLSHIAGAGELVAKRGQILRIIFISLWITVFAATGIFALNESFVRVWVGDQFFAGSVTNVILCLSLVIVSTFRLFSNMTSAIGEIKKTSIVVVVQSLLSLLVMGGLGSLYGLPGVASGAAVGASFGAVACGMLLVKNGVLNREILRLLFLESLVSLACLAITDLCARFFLPGADNWIAFAMNATIISVLFGSLLCFGSSAFRREVTSALKMIKRAAFRG